MYNGCDYIHPTSFPSAPSFPSDPNCSIGGDIKRENDTASLTEWPLTAISS